MPWKDVRPMDERILFIADYLRETDCFSRLCERYGVSRKTGYKWVARYRQTGTEGLEEQSRRWWYGDLKAWFDRLTTNGR